MFRIKSTPFVLPLIWTLLYLLLTGCQTDDIIAHPVIAANQEPAILGEDQGVKSFGAQQNVSVFPIAREKGYMDILILAENHGSDPIYFGRQNIVFRDQEGAPLEAPELTQVLIDLRQEAIRKAEALIAQARKGSGTAEVNMEDEVFWDAQRMRKQSTHTTNIRPEDIAMIQTVDPQKKLDAQIQALTVEYEDRMARLKETWLEEGQIADQDYYQGIIRAEFPEESVSSIVLDITLGAESHQVELRLDPKA